MSSGPALSTADVRKVAKLACLEITDAQAEQYRSSLSAVLGYMEGLRSLDLTGVQPMAHPSDATNVLAEDAPEPTLETAALMRMAPDRHEPFIKVPKVLGDSGGA